MTVESQYQDMENLLKHASSKHGPVSIWINNAGVEVETMYKPFGKKVTPAQSTPVATCSFRRAGTRTHSLRALTLPPHCRSWIPLTATAGSRWVSFSHARATPDASLKYTDASSLALPLATRPPLLNTLPPPRLERVPSHTVGINMIGVMDGMRLAVNHMRVSSCESLATPVPSSHLLDGARCALTRPAQENAGGAVVNVSSMSAFLPIPTAPVYAGTKAAVNQMTRCAGTFLGQDSDVRVHAVCPSFTDTPLVQGKDGLEEYVAAAGGR